MQNNVIPARQCNEAKKAAIVCSTMTSHAKQRPLVQLRYNGDPSELERPLGFLMTSVLTPVKASQMTSLTMPCRCTVVRG